MEPLAWHLVFRARDSRVIAPDVAAQRVVANACHSLAEPYGLLAFRAAGDHLHLQAACGREAAGALAQALGASLTLLLGLPGFRGTHLTACADQRHLESACLYVLRNTEKHGVSSDPTQEASSIGGLLGMRIVPGPFLGRVRRLVPIVDRDLLLAVLGVRTLEERFQIENLADAAAGAVGLTRLDASDRGFAARAAAVRVGLRHASAPRVCEVLGVSARSMRRHRALPEAPLLERAIGLRMGLLAELGDRARVEAPVPERVPFRPGLGGLRSTREVHPPGAR